MSTSYEHPMDGLTTTRILGYELFWSTDDIRQPLYGWSIIDCRHFPTRDQLEAFCKTLPLDDITAMGAWEKYMLETKRPEHTLSSGHQDTIMCYDRHQIKPQENAEQLVAWGRTMPLYS